jgi:hypothetical protein
MQKVSARQALLRVPGLTGQSAQVGADWADSTGVHFPIVYADTRVKAYRVEKK